MTFSNPFFLWAALGILIPLAIHLWSRKKVVTIKVGSTKWLKKSEPRRTSTIRPNEWWLLLLRVLTILLLAFILASPQLTRSIKNLPLTYLVEPSLLESKKMQGLLDTLPVAATRILADCFPKIEDYHRKPSDSKPTDKMPPNYWQLAQKMRHLPSDSIVVFTKALVSGIKGMRPQIDQTINFVRIEDENTAQRMLEARRKGDSLALLSMVGDGKRLGFETRKVSIGNADIEIDGNGDSISVAGTQLPLIPDRSLSVLVVYADSLSQEMRYIDAAFKILSKYLERDISVRAIMDVDSLDINTVTTDTYNVSIWLGHHPIEGSSRTRLIYRRDALAKDLIEPGRKKNEYYLTGRLNSENIVSGYLAEHLLMLLPLHPDLGRRISQYDSRTMDVEAFGPDSAIKELDSNRLELMDISPWLWGFLILVLVAERILAKFRKQ